MTTLKIRFDKDDRTFITHRNYVFKRREYPDVYGSFLAYSRIDGMPIFNFIFNDSFPIDSLKKYSILGNKVKRVECVKRLEDNRQGFMPDLIMDRKLREFAEDVLEINGLVMGDLSDENYKQTLRDLKLKIINND